MAREPAQASQSTPSASAKRIPPIQCLLTFEALARLRSVTQAAEELFVTPSAVSHRVKQLEQIIGTKLFGRRFGLRAIKVAYSDEIGTFGFEIRPLPQRLYCAGCDCIYQ